MRNVSLKSKVTSCIYPIKYITYLKNTYNIVEGLMFTDNKSLPIIVYFSSKLDVFYYPLFMIPYVTKCQNNYSKSFEQIKFLTQIYNDEWDKLADFNMESITKCCQYLGIKTKLIRASDLLAAGKKSELVLNICKELNADEYFASIGSKDYLEDHRNDFDLLDRELWSNLQFEIMIDLIPSLHQQSTKNWIDSFELS